MKTNTVTMADDHDASGEHPVPTIGGATAPMRDEHGLPTGAALLEWRRQHPGATIADAIAVPRL